MSRTRTVVRQMIFQLVQDAVIIGIITAIIGGAWRRSGEAGGPDRVAASSGCKTPATTPNGRAMR